jgi:hypothetical protein
MKSVYCAVRTGSLNKALCASHLKGSCIARKTLILTVNSLKDVASTAEHIFDGLGYFGSILQLIKL